MWMTWFEIIVFPAKDDADRVYYLDNSPIQLESAFEESSGSVGEAGPAPAEVKIRREFPETWLWEELNETRFGSCVDSLLDGAFWCPGVSNTSVNTRR